MGQPARKIRRRQNRIAKAAKVAPRPLGKLRPVVSCPTYKYNIKQRAGRGFTLEEIKAAGLSKKFARTIGIAVDHRRRNKSVESLQLNSQRLKEFKSKMILFPINAEEMSKAVQLAGTKVMAPKAVTKRPRAMAITADMQAFKAFQTIRQARAFKRLHGIRAKKAAVAEADELSKKK